MDKSCQTASNSWLISRYYLRYFPCLTAIYLIFITIFKMRTRPSHFKIKLIRQYCRATGINFTCSLCLRWQRLHKIYPSITASSVKWIDYLLINMNYPQISKYWRTTLSMPCSSDSIVNAWPIDTSTISLSASRSAKLSKFKSWPALTRMPFWLARLIQ